MGLKPGYKQTEVGVIPEDWEVRKILTFAPLQRGFDLPRSSLRQGIYPVVYSNGVVNYHNDFTTQGPGVITGRSGTIGSIHYVDSNYWAHNTSLWVTEFKNSAPKFVYYLFQIIGFSRFKTGSGVPTLNRNDVHDFQVAFPPSKAEQEAIAEALSDADALIESVEQLIAKKRGCKRGAMQALLTAKKRLSGFSEEWKTGVMSDYFDLVTTRNEELNDNVVTISAQRGFVRQEEFFKKRVASSVLSSYYLLERNQFAYNRSYSNGYPLGAIKLLSKYEKGVVTTLYICFKPKPNADISTSFFEQYFECGLLNIGLALVANEGGRAHGLLNVTKDDFFNRPIKVPAFDEQTAIAAVLSDMDAEITALETKLDKARRLKQGMMHNLLTGSIRLL